MAEGQGSKRGSSDILDAIYDKVADSPSTPTDTNGLFRPEALAQLDVAGHVDTQLSLVPRRLWLIAIGVCAVVVGVALWMALTPSPVTTQGSGRVLDPPGIVSVTSPAAGVVRQITTSESSPVTPGDPIAIIDTGDTSVDVLATVDAEVWQMLAAPGDRVDPRSLIATLVPSGSGSTVLVAVNESDAADIAVGMTVNLEAPGPATGTVTAVGAPRPTTDVAQRLGLQPDSDGLAVVVTISTDSELVPGALVEASVVTRDGSVADRLLERR